MLLTLFKECAVQIPAVGDMEIYASIYVPGRTA
jgi:hypothetical protein